MSFRRLVGLLLAGLMVGLARGEEPAERFPVTRDTWFSSVDAERDANLGGASKLKLKSYQELSLVDADLAALRGRVVAGATLHLRSTGEPRLARVTVGGIASEWFEGTSPTYAPEPNASTFRHRRHPADPWTPGGGDLAEVILGTGGTTRWQGAEATAPDALGWQTVAVDPLVVASRVAGLSRGFVLFDDTGTEWTRQGNDFTVRPMPNRFVASRDSNRASAPYFTITVGSKDDEPPPPPLDLRAEVGDLPSGEAVVTWTTPPDRGPAGTLGFEVAVDGDPLPPSVVPLARLAPERNRLHLRHRRLPAGAAVKLTIHAVDAAGNVGPAARLDLAVSRRAPRPLPPGDTAPRADRPGRLAWNGGTVAVLDELDKFDPQRGTVIPPARASEDDLAANHLWDAARRQIVLTAARNEFVGFQVVGLGLRGPVTAGLRWTHRPGGSSPIGTIHRAIAVATPLGPLPDPVVPAVGPVDLATSPLYCEVYVPSDARPGVHDGKLTLQSPGATLELNVSLQVLDFALPDTLGFVPELNAYDLPEPELASYRLAHRHRTSLNRVPYSQRGVVAPGMAPPILADGRLDWAAWDARFGPLLDGSAFADLPRRGVPVASFYLPLHENWPTPIEGSYDGGYWADSSFKPGYRKAFVAASRRFAEHFDARGWTGPVFEGFLNNKRDFKAGGRGWSGGSSPWLLDEPASWQDFVALRYFAAAFHEGIAQARSQTRGQRPAKLAFRADISRPEWQRDGLDGLLDVNVVSGVMRDRQRLMMDRKRDQNQWMFEYGTANAVDQANVQPAAWCIDAWTLGMDGVIPWQTIGRAESWTTGDELALLYPPNPAVAGAETGPVPSLRLKAFRRGQQDVEYLIRWAALHDQPRWAVAAEVRRALGLAATRAARGPDDAGSVAYPQLRPVDLWTLRRRIGHDLAAASARPDPPAPWTPTPRRVPAGGR